jgi:Aminopeptidase P, N-terminal domain
VSETPSAVARRGTANEPVRAATIAVQLQRRRHAAAEQWQLDHQVVLIGAGDKIPVPGRGDRTYAFRAHSEYLYLTDRERPGGVLAFDPYEGGSTSLCR